MTDVSAADVGARVVVRHALPAGGATDVLGELVAWADGVLTIASRTGEVQVEQSALLAVKRIPPAPPRRR